MGASTSNRPVAPCRRRMRNNSSSCRVVAALEPKYFRLVDSLLSHVPAAKSTGQIDCNLSARMVAQAIQTGEFGDFSSDKNRDRSTSSIEEQTPVSRASQARLSQRDKRKSLFCRCGRDNKILKTPARLGKSPEWIPIRFSLET